MMSTKKVTIQKQRIRGAVESLILGARRSAPATMIGFQQAVADEESQEELIHYSGDAHMLTCAPSRSGKGTGVIIPALLSYAGPVIVTDCKRENVMVVARRRRELGQQVVVLDPFGSGDTGGLNPFDVLNLPGADIESDSQALAELCACGIKSSKDAFWDLMATGLVGGVIAAVAADSDATKHHFGSVVDYLMKDDIFYNLAVLLDTRGKAIPKLAYQEISAFLQCTDVTRSGILAVAQSYLKGLAGERVQRSLTKSTFSLGDVIGGAPLSIFLVVPPDRLASHRALLKLWIGSLLKAIFSRRQRPKLRTLVLLDEAAALESFPYMEPLYALSAGYAVWVHTIWQDLSQLQSHYPLSWKNILNNCGVIQTFGFHNRDLANQWSGYLRHSSLELLAIRPEQQVLAIHGQPELICRRLNYLHEPIFQGMFDPNEFFADQGIKTGVNR